MKKRCGDFGGRSIKTGKPCQRYALGNVARCASHTVDEVGLREERKAKFLEAFPDMPTITEAAKAIGLSMVQLWRWRKDDADFDAAVTKLTEDAPDVRNQMVEDSMFRRIVEDRATAAETIFWLVNRGRGRWKHVSHVRQSNVNLDPANLTEEELQAIAAGADPVEVLAKTRGEAVAADRDNAVP